jgi:hypothetical protein
VTTETTNDARDLQVYGATQAEIQAAFEYWTTGPLKMTKEAMVTSILSDVQELMSMGRLEGARQKVNVVKYILMEL